MAGWRVMFVVMGAIGLVGIVPLFIAALRPESEAPYAPASTSGPRHSKPLTFASLGGYPFLLLLFSYAMQGMLFWGVTLWIPLAVKSVGFRAVASSLPVSDGCRARVANITN
jgi:MFS family permease